MTYLQLINQVLMRLRETQASSSVLNSNPFYSMIGAAVNDAKNTVEDSWEWGALRGADSVTVAKGVYDVPLPLSLGVTYNIESVVNTLTGAVLTPVPLERIRALYARNATTPVGESVPSAYGFAPDLWDEANPAAATNGTTQIRLTGPASVETPLTVYRSAHQAQLVGATDKLKVPALPVYLLATALASRERGEIGGTPTGELFAMAGTALSDAIAMDSSRFSGELFWYNPSDMSQSNVGTA